MALVLDTGVLYSVLDRGQARHEECVRLLTESRDRRIVPDLVLVELDYFLRKSGRLVAWKAFVAQVADGTYAIYPLSAATLERAAELEERYADLDLGLVDASVVAVCEELQERKLATLDRRHFSVVRTADGTALTLLPDQAER